MKNVKVGMIGCGWIANFHLDNLLKIDGVEVIALASPNENGLKETSKKVSGVHTYSNHKQMYDQEEQLDAVFICVPPDRHSDAEILAASKGIHIYVEKPIERSLEKALVIDAAVKKAGIITSVGFQERYNEGTEEIKKFIADRKVGLVSGRWLGGMPGALWWRKKESSGGQIVEQSIHILDILRYFFGEAHSVYSSATKGIVNNVEGYNIEDCSSTTITFKSGVIATVFTACYLEELEAFDGVGFEIVCSDAAVKYTWNKEVIYTTKNSIVKVPFEGNNHLKAVQTFIEAVKTGNPEYIKSPYSDAVKSLEIALAANESMNRSMPVFLDNQL